MHINISIDTDMLNPTERNALAALVHGNSYLPGGVRQVSGLAGQPQPQVGDNSGTASGGVTSSPPTAGGVSGEGAKTEEIGGQPSPAPENLATQAPEKRKPGRPKKEEVAAAQPDPSPAASSPTPPTQQAASSGTAAAAPADPQPTTATLTMDDVRAKLQAFTAVKGIEAGIALLQEFSAGRISELKPADYAKFVEKCALEVTA